MTDVGTKRPLDPDEDDFSSRPSKLSKAELYRPPTNEELNHLRETENLYQSSLFRMQMKELLNEVMIKDKRSKEITQFVNDLAKFLKGLKKGEEYPLMDQSWCGEYAVPIDQSLAKSKAVYRFHAPLDVRLVGSFHHGTVVKPCRLDLTAVIPRGFFLSTDFMNHRYHRKRALYLVSLASHIEKSFDGVEKMEFSYLHGNRWKPVLVMTPKGKLGKHVTFIIHTSVEDGTFKLSRFHIGKNSIRSNWCPDIPKQIEKEPEVPTPYYNTAALQDLLVENNAEFIEEVLETSSEIRQGIVLLKVWLRQRGLDKTGGLTGHALTMYVVHLLKTKTLNKLMSAYQVFRNTLLALGSSRFDEGVTLAMDCEEERPSLDEFREAFRLVFVDPSGWMNLVSMMSTGTYEWLKHECRQAIHILEELKSDSFSSLFMTPMPFLHTFDYVFHMKDTNCLSHCIKQFNLRAVRADRMDRVAAVLPKLLDLLKKGLGQRVTLLAYRINDVESWPLTTKPPSVDRRRISFGFCVDPDNYSTVLDRGPPADAPEAKDFQAFWGERSELRRFQDASICEAVVWQAKTLAQRRTVCLQIVEYLLERHAGIAPSHIVHHCDKLDVVLQPAQTAHKPMPYGTGEEQVLSVMRSYDALSKCLRKMRDLPLSIDAVRGSSPVFSYTEVFPSTLHSKNRITHTERPLTSQNKPCTYAPCMEVVCAVEGSGKWPEDEDAIRRLKAAFYIKLAACLTSTYNVTSKAFADHVVAVQDGHVFRVVIAVTREIAVMKMVRKTSGMLKMVDTDRAVKLEMDVVKRPLLRSSLHAVQQTHNTFTVTARLFKRWVASQMLMAHIDDIVLDLLAAYVYVNASPYSPPRSAFSGLLRVLKLLSTFDWKLNPLVVNFNNAIDKSELDELQMNFTRDRASLPLMYVVTPHDMKSAFTRRRPTAPVLHRLVRLADVSVKQLEEQYGGIETVDFKLIFRPPLHIYDVLIHLNPAMLARAHLAVDVADKAALPHLVHRVADPRLIVTNEFDPVTCYLNELEEIYGDVALFCHDPYGGAVIGVLWKPGFAGEKEYKVSNMNYHRIDTDSAADKPMLVPNHQAILDDFAILGRGLVTEVKVKDA